MHFNYIPSPKSKTHFRLRSCRNNIRLAAIVVDVISDFNTFWRRRGNAEAVHSEEKYPADLMHRPDDSFPQISGRLAPIAITATKKKTSSVYIERHFNNHCLSLPPSPEVNM